MSHNHEDADVLTFGCDACRAASFTIKAPAPDGLSYGARLTAQAQYDIEHGRHPANGLAINTFGTCGECVHLEAIHYHSKHLLKCEFHRLGKTHSEASDMRRKWPSCPHFSAASDGHSPV